MIANIVLVNPSVRHIGNLGCQWQIIAAKVARFLPVLAVFIDPAEGYIVPHAILGEILPNGSFDSPQPNLVGRLARCLIACS